MDWIDEVSKWFEELWEATRHVFHKYSAQIVMLILGYFTTAKAISLSHIKLNKKQKTLQYICGSTFCMVVPTALNELSIHFWQYELGLGMLCLLAFISGELGIEGVTRVMVSHVNKKKKEDK